MSRLMERFWMPLFLTPAVRICQVRALKERKYKLPVAIFYDRDVNVRVA